MKEDVARVREWSIQELARLAGTTSRTLRHYQAEHLLEPSRVGDNGYRYYTEASLIRLQRILLLRELGLGLPAIRTVLADHPASVPALRTHLELLRSEQERLARQIASVQHTIEEEEGGGDLMAEKMFDGFDHTAYKDEVEQRWGREAYASGDRWWRGKSDAERAEWKAASDSLLADWRNAAESGVAPDSERAQALARRQYDWLTGIPGTPATPDGRPTREYYLGLAEMYPADERFAANYGGRPGAEFTRDAMREFATRNL